MAPARKEGWCHEWVCQGPLRDLMCLSVLAAACSPPCGFVPFLWAGDLVFLFFSFNLFKFFLSSAVNTTHWFNSLLTETCPPCIVLFVVSTVTPLPELVPKTSPSLSPCAPVTARCRLSVSVVCNSAEASMVLRTVSLFHTFSDTTSSTQALEVDMHNGTSLGSFSPAAAPTWMSSCAPSVSDIQTSPSNPSRHTPRMESTLLSLSDNSNSISCGSPSPGYRPCCHDV